MNLHQSIGRTFAATAAPTVAGVLGAGQAVASDSVRPEQDPIPASAEVQQQRDLADGKLDPEHLAHKQAKDAEELRLGIAPLSGGARVPTTTVERDGNVYYAPLGVNGQAEVENNLCAYGQVCLYYNSGLRNANFPRKGTSAQLSNYSGYTYNNGRGLPGYGQGVKNNAASIMNGYEGKPSFGVFYNSGWKGDRGWFIAGDGRNLPSWLKNENASGRF
ncbi:hypothetical protein [Streptomyces sp. N35]|uniref:hypothetical protein n=1 Tax=Streptomyces sp. N35 TaxID=2795730 RepID=UPI0018F2ED29|nr:hypothetical protein [Streptomyces sp. N35]